MTENETNRVSVKIYKRTQGALKDEANSVRKATGVEPSFAELLEAAWSSYKSQPSSATKPTSPVERSPVPPELEPYVHNFALWLIEEPLSEKERAFKDSLMRIFAPKQKGRKRA